MSNPRIRQILKDFVGYYIGADDTLDGHKDNYKSQKRLHDSLVKNMPETAQLIEDYFLELVNECDPTPNSQNKSYWGNKLRNKIRGGEDEQA